MTSRPRQARQDLLLAFAVAIALRWSVLQIVRVPFVGRIGFAHLLCHVELGIIVWRQGPEPAFTVTLPLWPLPILVGGVFLTALWWPMRYSRQV